MMFGLFRKKRKNLEIPSQVNEFLINMDRVKVWYEGDVLCGDYDLNDSESYPYHNLFPHGKGHLIYRMQDRPIEEYKGDFAQGQYHGNGLLVNRNGEVFRGQFWENSYVGDP